MVQAGLGIKQDPISKVARAKRARDMASVVKSLPRKLEAQSSNSSTTK
jgi:hypothetical protein